MMKSATSAPPPLPWAVRSGAERTILLVVAGALVAGGLYLLAAALTGSGWVCAWKSSTGWPCASCGGTRSLALLAAGEWREAVKLNPGVMALVAGVVVAAMYAAAVLVFRFEPWRPRMPAWRWVLGAAFVLNWVYLVWAGRV